MTGIQFAAAVGDQENHKKYTSGNSDHAARLQKKSQTNKLTKMKRNSNKNTNPAISAPILSLTIEGVEKQFGAFRGIQPHEHTSNNFQVESAQRNAWCDLREALVKLEIKKLSSGASLNPTKQRLCELEGELEEIAAMRKLGTIYDSIARAANELGAVTFLAKPHFDRLSEMKEKAGAMKARLENFQSRDIRDEYSVLETQKNEVRWLRELFENGRWRTRNLDDRDEALKNEMRQMSGLGRYVGEPTREAAELRIVSLEKDIADTEARMDTQLTSDEMSEMPRLVKDIEDIDTAILEEFRYSHFAISTAQFQERKFSELLEAARISAEGVVETYQVTREMTALQVA